MKIPVIRGVIDRRILTTRFHQHADAEVRPRQGRQQPDCLAVLLERPVSVALHEIRSPEVETRVGVARGDLNRLGELCDRPWPVARIECLSAHQGILLFHWASRHAVLFCVGLRQTLLCG